MHPSSIPDTLTASPDDLAKWIIGTGMPLSEDEREFLNDVMNVEKYVYWGCNHNVEKLHSLRIMFWMSVGFIRSENKL